jgi:hypothetical protein
MEKKEITIPISNEYQFFRYYVEFMNAFKHLREREKDVFASLLMFNNKLRNHSVDIREKLLLDYDIKMQIKEALGIKDDNFNCIIHTLRQKDVLKDRKINPLYEVFPDFPFTLNITFNETVQE